MYGETFYGCHTAQHQLQWRQINSYSQSDPKIYKTRYEQTWVLIVLYVN